MGCFKLLWEHVKVVLWCSGKGEKEGEEPLFKINWAGTSMDNRGKSLFRSKEGKNTLCNAAEIPRYKKPKRTINLTS